MAASNIFRKLGLPDGSDQHRQRRKYLRVHQPYRRPFILRYCGSDCSPHLLVAFNGNSMNHTLPHGNSRTLTYHRFGNLVTITNFRLMVKQHNAHFNAVKILCKKSIVSANRDQRCFTGTDNQTTSTARKQQRGVFAITEEKLIPFHHATTLQHKWDNTKFR